MQLTAGNDRLIKLAAEVANRAQSRAKAAPEDVHAYPAVEQLDLFVADLLSYALKDDVATMEAPLFSLSTIPDMQIWKWTSTDGKKWLEVTPSSLGRATMHDKDLLIYLSSQVVSVMNTAARTEVNMPSRRIQFTAHHFMVSTGRDTSGAAYDNLEKTLDRLAGTRLKTNIEVGEIDHRTGFGLIESYSCRLKKGRSGKKRLEFIEVTLSEWLYRALERREILTINQEYFGLRKPLERRLYELARKHVGNQADWSIGLDNLLVKTGSKATSKEFTRMLREIIKKDTLLDYRAAITESVRGDALVRFYQKDQKKLVLAYQQRQDAKVVAEAKRFGSKRAKPVARQPERGLFD